MGLQGWRGDLGGCTPILPCFCEQIIMDAIIREESQTWSNLGLILSGLGILLWMDISSKEPSTELSQNPMTHPTLYSVLYGMLTINIGIGSFWFHGSLLRYAEFMDTFAMNMYIIFLLYYILIRLTRKSQKLFLLLYIPSIIIFGVIEWVINNGTISVWIFSVFAGIAITAESISLTLIFKSKRNLKWITREWKWFSMGVGVFFLSFLIWNVSLPGNCLCNPNTWIQGHSFWHLGVAASTFFLFVYCRSEKIAAP